MNSSISKKTLLIIGCGDLGTRIANLIASPDWDIYGVRRDISQLPETIKGVSVDLYDNTPSKNWPKDPIDYVVYCVAPNAKERDNYYQLYYTGLQHTLHWLQQAQLQPKRLFVVSSTAVYQQNDGQWLDEDSPTEPTSTQGKTMLAMEQLALTSGLATTCVRLAGIYGPNRSYLLNQAKQGIHFPAEPLLYANRIYIDDAAALLKHLINYHLAGKSLKDCYIGIDDTPAPIQETLTWLRQQLAITQLADDYGIRNVSSKRLSNKRARATGWSPCYPSYKEGYKKLLS